MKYNRNIVIDFFLSEGIPWPKLEHKFHETRKWRFDFAWDKYRVYLEVDGGIWIAGRHSRGASMKKDWEKRNAATELGWRGLWVEPKDLCTVDTANMIKRALGLTGQSKGEREQDV